MLDITESKSKTTKIFSVIKKRPAKFPELDSKLVTNLMIFFPF